MISKPSQLRWGFLGLNQMRMTKPLNGNRPNWKLSCTYKKINNPFFKVATNFQFSTLQQKWVFSDWIGNTLNAADR